MNNQEPQRKESYYDKLRPEHFEELSTHPPDDVALRSLAVYHPETGFSLSLAGRDYLVNPWAREVVAIPEHQPVPFLVGLVTVMYLLHADYKKVTGRLVTAQELKGGTQFFVGPHALSTQGLIRKYGHRSEEFRRVGLALGGKPVPYGDVAVEIPALPKVPLTYILYTADEEFEARMVIGFDASVESHLPLDVIWGLVELVSGYLEHGNEYQWNLGIKK
ncbi:MAG: DUF3786 domain-containing protein [Deltaproteobacteria bacterium]|nr:DUF3786 domain-containing protein [Deltaproteobacteria bacterium]